MAIEFNTHDRLVVVHGKSHFSHSSTAARLTYFVLPAVFAVIAVLGTAPAAILCARYMKMNQNPYVQCHLSYID